MTDASLIGWGAVMDGHSAQGLWKGPHLSWYLNHLKKRALFLALRHFFPDLGGYHVLMWMGNASVVIHTPCSGLCSRSCPGRMQTALTEGRLHARTPQYGNRHSVEAGTEAWELATPPSSSRHGANGLVCLEGSTHCPLWFVRSTLLPSI